MQNSVLHIIKCKTLKDIGRHIDRKYTAPNVDPSKTHLNEKVVCQSLEKKMTLEEAVAQRIAEGYSQNRTLRRNAIRVLLLLMAGSHERMKEIEADEELFNAWKKDNYDFVRGEFGDDNIIGFWLHRDERTPHIHCVDPMGWRQSARQQT